MSRRDFERHNARDNARQRGSEDVRGRTPSGIVIGSSRPAMQQPDKATLRQQADAAWRQWSATRVSS
jgi:hypothetical protein